MNAASKHTPQGAAEASNSGGEHESARRTKTRERLMDAAYRRFSEHGINGTSIEAIADDAGFTRGAFYSNFESKNELFFALTERENSARLRDLQQHITDLVEPLGRVEGKPAPEAFESAIAEVLKSQSDSRQWYLMHTEFRLLALRDPEVAQRFLESDLAFLRQLAQAIDAAIHSMGLRFVLDPLQATRLLVNQYESALQDAIFSGAEDSEATAHATATRSLPALVHGLTTEIAPD